MTSGEFAIHFAAMSGWISPSFVGRSKNGGVLAFGAQAAACADRALAIPPPRPAPAPRPPARPAPAPRAAASPRPGAPSPRGPGPAPRAAGSLLRQRELIAV